MILMKVMMNAQQGHDDLSKFDDHGILTLILILAIPGATEQIREPMCHSSPSLKTPPRTQHQSRAFLRSLSLPGAAQCLLSHTCTRPTNPDLKKGSDELKGPCSGLQTPDAYALG